MSLIIRQLNKVASIQIPKYAVQRMTSMLFNIQEIRPISNLTYYATYLPPNRPLSHPPNRGICTCQTHMATKKAKSKKKSGGGGNKVDFTVADGVIDMKLLQRNMDTFTTKYRDECLKYSPKLTNASLDNVSVKINGVKSSLYEVSSVTSSPKEFIVTPMVEGDEVLKELVQALHASGLHLNPREENKVIKVPIPLASSDRRKSMLKQAKVSAENTKVAIRKIRQQGFVDLRKYKDEVSKDDIRRIENQIQVLTDNSTQQVDQILSKKEEELQL